MGGGCRWYDVNARTHIRLKLCLTCTHVCRTLSTGLHGWSEDIDSDTMCALSSASRTAQQSVCRIGYHFPTFFLVYTVLIVWVFSMAMLRIFTRY
ncbi:MAG: hypothetical protein FE78DRAFT_283600 [Acidomyces sp. 'richmondensis']|nr:MAG: hypothetical protein FE78DRAFT_283600 [Acidomyces sp. 'richmondensis']